ncbi:MAG: hypothetical protein RID91_12505 [Azospirillaceae bacterium]
MGWRSTLRSLEAASRRAAKEAERQRKQEAREQMVAEASDAVEAWQEHIDDLVSVHTDLAEAVNWERIAALPRPEEPTAITEEGDRARAALDSFKPRVFDPLIGGSERRRRRLEASLDAAVERDRARSAERLAEYKEALAEWEEDTTLAKNLLLGEPEAVRTVIQEKQSFTENGLIGKEIQFSIGGGYVHAKPEVHDDEIVPRFRRKQLASGRLSETKMPISQRNELYQDYVSSISLKVAGDLFNIIPMDSIYVTCFTRMLNNSTGHIESTPILSVKFVRQTIVSLNLDAIDPSEALRNFNHVMSFKKTKGFARIEPLEPA